MARLPLACVFRSFEVVRTSAAKRVVHSKSICGRWAPRDVRNHQVPKFPNRFGDPLCAEHRTYADDENAFPDEQPFAVSIKEV